MDARLAAPLFALAWVACRTTPPEPAAVAQDAGPRPPGVHVLAESDHRSRTEIAKGDLVELPRDPAYVWSIQFENGSYFDPAPASDAGVPRFLATRTGIDRAVVLGEPRICLRSDAPCPRATYSWNVTLDVR